MKVKAEDGRYPQTPEKQYEQSVKKMKVTVSDDGCFNR